MRIEGSYDFVDAGEGGSQLVGFTTKNHRLVVAVDGRKLNVHPKGLEDLVNVGSTGATDELVLALFDGHGQFTASRFL